MIRLPAALLLACLIPLTAQAAVDPYKFDTEQQEDTYKELIEELRCLVCQNQNLADSNAELALDLRRQVKDMVTAGQDRDQVVDYMVSRYGDFVMYRPPMRTSTLLLWFGPLLLLLIGLVALVVIVRRQRAANISETADLDEEQQKRARQLLQGDQP
jgi:cytochrome c-type biogenesis protein CcmH